MICLIPARIGSKGVALKNIRDLGGYPLLAWSIAAGRLLGYPTVVSSDSMEILEVSDYYGGQSHLRVHAGDTQTDIEVVADILSGSSRKDADEIIYLRPTTPFRNPVLLADAVDWWKSGEYDSLCSGQFLPEPASKYLKFTDNSLVVPLLDGIKLNNIHNPRQGEPETFKTNGVIDIIKTDRIKDGIIWGEKMFGYQTEPTVEIDTPEDLDYANWWLKRNGHPIHDYLKAIYGR